MIVQEPRFMEDKADIFVKPYLVNPLCFRKKKGNNQNLFFTFKGKQDLVHNTLSLFLPPRFTLKLLEGEGKTETYD